MQFVQYGDQDALVKFGRDPFDLCRTDDRGFHIDGAGRRVVEFFAGTGCCQVCGTLGEVRDGRFENR